MRIWKRKTKCGRCTHKYHSFKSFAQNHFRWSFVIQNQYTVFRLILVFRFFWLFWWQQLGSWMNQNEKIPNLCWGMWCYVVAHRLWMKKKRVSSGTMNFILANQEITGHQAARLQYLKWNDTDIPAGLPLIIFTFLKMSFQIRGDMGYQPNSNSNSNSSRTHSSCYVFSFEHCSIFHWKWVKIDILFIKWLCNTIRSVCIRKKLCSFFKLHFSWRKVRIEVKIVHEKIQNWYHLHVDMVGESIKWKICFKFRMFITKWLSSSSVQCSFSSTQCLKLCRLFFFCSRLPLFHIYW